MKKIIKYIIKIFTKVIISFLSSINSGRYFIDELIKYGQDNLKLDIGLITERRKYLGL